MTISTELAELVQMRLSDAYHTAETLRQGTRGGAQAMAEYPPGSAEYAAVRLLIGTWETMAHRVRTNDPLKVPFYQISPVGYMWINLSPGIVVIRKEIAKTTRKKAAALLYAREFELLKNSYRIWLNNQLPMYQTAALNGINALFG